jgi:PncC family amidohydrolase
MRPETLTVIKKVHSFFKNTALTLSAAESCTGGLVSHYLTTLSGASAFFAGGVICYSEKTKTDIIGVSNEIIRVNGVVSKETAREMAEKVRLLVKTDFSISTTGNLGPDALEGKEKGLIYGKTVSRELRLGGNRDANKEEAAISALRLLIELAEKR